MSQVLHPPQGAVRQAVSVALAEDLLPLGDLTAALLPRAAIGRAAFVSRGHGVVAGTACVVETCRQVDHALVVRVLRDDGTEVAPEDEIIEVRGAMASIVTSERTALNFLCHLSGIASLTARYVAAAGARNPATRVLDTRKTTPGLRALEKAAVRAGGGFNHRGSLSEGVLVKDNHLGHTGITEAVRRARELWPGRMVEVECDRVEQVREAAEAGATIVLCDNMSPDELRHCAELVRSIAGVSSRTLVEASGGISLDTVGEFAAAGADLVSVGALTHSAPVLDVGLDLKAAEVSGLG
ncbi:MAG: carboxylating nicotinate-nucleotide diphosphorylase [Actinomycetota bacterium]|jgi:nicotinate-nucleotide pyrophosphorylase (carboxylating)|nr:carboxylating nicotinate-nucleotide diphosphorylase [Actinomycetota bacterium]